MTFREEAPSWLRWLVMGLLCPWPAVAFGERLPVLGQIDHECPYYFREMYLPQLNEGPSSVAWAPDGKTLVYSMGGTLWRQRIDSIQAEQLTDGPGYDYQPDWSPDGRFIVFVRYLQDAMELYMLEVVSPESPVSTMSSWALTASRAVQVEPRWSPDGKRIAFVSTQNNRHFHIFVASMNLGKIEQLEQFTAEHRSEAPRFFYGPVDHEISPSWAPNGQEIYFVSNRDRIYGSGGFWRKRIGSSDPPIRVHDEETMWKARPDVSPDGMRLIYSSYLGRQWHQLWTLPVAGGDPFPLSYGEFDVTAARWSPDGRHIAFISNQGGVTSLWILESIGGAQKEIKAETKKYFSPRATLTLVVLDEQGRKTPARVSITGPDGRAYGPESSMMRADDSYDRTERPFEPHYFHTAGESQINLPAGEIRVEILKGLQRRFEKRSLRLSPNAKRTLSVRLAPLDPKNMLRGWSNADLQVHMNFGGTYRNRPSNLVLQQQAEDVNLVEALAVNKEQRVPDHRYPLADPDSASKKGSLLLHGQEFHSSYWGHLGLLGMNDHLLLPGYAGYVNTSAASLVPTNSMVADLARQQGGLVGYVHPFDSYPDPAKREEPLTHALPVDVAQGLVDYLEVMGFSDHKATAAVWYQLLNCGFRLPAGAGSDAMANYTSLRGPVGVNRVFADTGGILTAQRFWKALRAGKTFATNGPLLGFTIGGKGLGEELILPKGAHEVAFNGWVRSIVPVDHLEVVYNGQVVFTADLSKDRTKFDFSGKIKIEESGWMLLRAWSERAMFPVLDAYAYATTSPVYVTIGGSPKRSKKDAEYFIAWIDRVIQDASNHPGYNTEQEKQEVLSTLARARKVFEERR